MRKDDASSDFSAPMSEAGSAATRAQNTATTPSNAATQGKNAATTPFNAATPVKNAATTPSNAATPVKNAATTPQKAHSLDATVYIPDSDSGQAHKQSSVSESNMFAASNSPCNHGSSSNTHDCLSTSVKGLENRVQNDKMNALDEVEITVEDGRGTHVRVLKNPGQNDKKSATDEVENTVADVHGTQDVQDDDGWGLLSVLWGMATTAL
jgi:hypothetical protein